MLSESPSFQILPWSPSPNARMLSIEYENPSQHVVSPTYSLRKDGFFLFLQFGQPYIHPFLLSPGSVLVIRRTTGLLSSSPRLMQSYKSRILLDLICSGLILLKKYNMVLSVTRFTSAALRTSRFSSKSLSLVGKKLSW